MNLHPIIAQALAGFMPPALRRCTEADCSYQGQAAASSCGCMDDKLMALDDDMLLCLTCSGSGEGSSDGATCRACKGLGEVEVTA